jgi:hypothetical protein
MNAITTGVARKRLDCLFAFDAAASVFFGVVALLTPHGILMRLYMGEYNHNVHETLRWDFFELQRLGLIQDCDPTSQVTGSIGLPVSSPPATRQTLRYSSNSMWLDPLAYPVCG